MPRKTRSESKTGYLNRRGFLKSSLAGSMASVALPAFSYFNDQASEQKSASGVESFELAETTITDLQEGMKSGRLTSRSIAEKYIGRIEAVDRQGPTLRSVIELNPDALEIAEALDSERREKGPRGPMHGIPVLIKDNIDTADKMATTAGSLALVGSKPQADAFVVQQLRQAGAVILGKTNLSEWANIRSNKSTSGWSGRGGLTKNPYVLDRNPSGSSSGSAVAVSSNLCAVAIGTETDGSIVSPSSINGIVGIKPTVGLISRSGIIPIAHTQDTAGPIARSVRDAAILLSAMAAHNDEYKMRKAINKIPAPPGLYYAMFLDPAGLKGKRIGVVRKYFGFHRDVDKVINNALEVLKAQGTILVDPADIATIGQFDDAELTVLLYELKADLNRYLSGLGPNAPVHSLKEIIEFNERNAEKEMPYFGQDLFLKAEAKGPLTSKEYLDALHKCGKLARKEGIDAVMDKYNLDALVAPTDGPAWLTDLIDGDHYIGGSSTAAAVAGHPSITVPAGYVHGLPVGISFFGRAWSEPMLLQLAYAFEQATKHRQAPAFLPTADLSRQIAE
jgi:amidase